MEEQKQIRCAIYTRKSTDEGLEKEFNTLEAQREAGENFVMSMKHQGWVILPDHYDDGGFSGGNLKRPALKRLMADVEKGKVDMIVVYKIDRLTRSLLDFAQLVQTFEKNNCSFVSVTQHFNTCDSMGKLTLNILLSFAQFERELGAERVRDKIAASKKKGMWTGGPTPLGYDIKEKKLIINQEEAEVVKFIFDDYLKTKSQLQTMKNVNEKGYKPKTRVTKTGRVASKGRFNHSMISNILSNPIYIGMVAYKDTLYEGQHKGIIDKAVWDNVADLKKSNIGSGFSPQKSEKVALLKGLLECECCGAMTPTRSKKGNKYYEYYTSSKAVKEGVKTVHCQIGSIPAGEIESFVLDKVKKIFQSPDLQQAMLKEFERQNANYNGADVNAIIKDIGEAFKYFEPATIHDFIKEVVRKVIVCHDHIEIKLKPLSAALFEDGTLETDENFDAKQLELKYPIRFGRKRGRVLIIEPTPRRSDQGERDSKLYNAVTQAFYWKQQMEKRRITLTELAKQEHTDRGYMGQILKLTTLAPDIIMAIIEGRQPKLLTTRGLIRGHFPYIWEDQRRELGFK